MAEGLGMGGFGSVGRRARFHGRKLTSLLYAGSRFSCSVCGGRFRKMLPLLGQWYVRGVLTDHYTPNAICPRCGSDIRHRFIVEYLRNRTDLLARPHRVLHIAPEICIAESLRHGHLDYVGADIEPHRFPGAVFADITRAPFPDNDFDVLLCVHVLEHILDDRLAIRELYRVLKPGGWALIAVPTYGEVTFEDPALDEAGRERQYGIADHRRMNGLDFVDKLREARFGVFVVSLDDMPGDFFDRAAKSPHIDSDRHLFHCVKPLE